MILPRVLYGVRHRVPQTRQTQAPSIFTGRIVVTALEVGTRLIIELSALKYHAPYRKNALCTVMGLTAVEANVH